MKLLHYEMKKLLFNKSRIIFLAVLFMLYTVIAYMSAMGEYELSGEERKSAISGHSRLVAENAGKLNPDQLAESQKKVEAVIAKHGKGEAFRLQLNRDPVLKFHFKYMSLGQSVAQYWNGPEEQDKTNIRGVYPLQEKLAELEAANHTNTYEYKYYHNRLETELSLGEPTFEGTLFWNYYFITFDGLKVVFLLLMVLAFFISPLFTQEIKTEMDSIVLCSAKGRCEIVTAKLLCAGLTSAVIAAVYLLGSFIGTLIGYGDLSGMGAPLRCLEGFQQASLDLSVGGAAALGSGWLILASVIFGLALSFISSKTRNQSSAFGLGIVILLAGSMSNYLGNELKKLIWPIVDFNFGTLSTFGAIFGESKAYNVFGIPTSYGAVAFIVSLVLGMAACSFTYIAQKNRSAV